jgi:hypothetical protein
MSDIPPSVIEHLRVALLNEVRTLAETLHSISDDIDAELAQPSPNVEPLQVRFLDLAVTLQTHMRLHARLGCPSERIATWMLTFRDSEERDLAHAILDRYRDQLFTRLTSGELKVIEKEPLLKTLGLLTDFLRVTRIDPDSTIELRRADGSER